MVCFIFGGESLMNKKNIFILSLFIISILLILPSINASYKFNTDIELTQTCNNCTSCNVTKVIAPDRTILITNQNMTKDGTSYNYTLQSTNTSQFGEYEWTYECGNEVEMKVGSKFFEVSSIGITQTTSQGISSAIYLVLMIVLTVMFSYFSIRLYNNKTWKLLGIFFGFFAFLLLVYDVWLGYEYHRALTGLTNSGVPEIIFYIFMTLITVGFLASLGLLFLRWKEVMRYIKKEIKRKDNDEDLDDWDIDNWK